MKIKLRRFKKYLAEIQRLKAQVSDLEAQKEETKRMAHCTRKPPPIAEQTVSALVNWGRTHFPNLDWRDYLPKYLEFHPMGISIELAKELYVILLLDNAIAKVEGKE